MIRPKSSTRSSNVAATARWWAALSNRCGLRLGLVVRPPPPLNRYTLAGVVVSGDARTALVKSQNNAKITILKQGEQLDGWTLQQISETQLLFTAGKSTYEMTLPKPSEVRR